MPDLSVMKWRLAFTDVEGPHAEPTVGHEDILEPLDNAVRSVDAEPGKKARTLQPDYAWPEGGVL